MSELNQQEQERLANLLKEEDANQGSKFSWDDSFQTRLIGMLLTDRYFLVQSLDKIKPAMSEFNKWLSKYSGPYILSYKLDGISALIQKVNDKFYMYTRGDGVYGQDISHVIKHININTNLLKNNDAFRGELIISKKNFEIIKDKMANARNAVSGIINTKKPDPEMLKLIDFVAYWVMEP